MKAKIAILLLLSSVTAGAFTGELTEARRVTDLMLMPKAGKHLVSADLGFSFSSPENTLGNAINYTSDVDGIDTVLNYGYAYSDRVLFSLELPYLLGEDEKRSYANGTTNNLSRGGLGNIKVMAKYRLLKQDPAQFRTDVYLALGPALGDEEVAAVNSDGNNYTGKGTIAAGVQIGKQFTRFGFRVGLEVASLSSSDGKYLSTNTTFTEDSTARFAMNLATQYYFNKNYSGELSFGGEHIGQYNRTTGTTTETVDPDMTVQWGLKGNYLHTKSLAFTFSYEGTKLSEALVSGGNLYIDESTVTRLALGVRYMF